MHRVRGYLGDDEGCAARVFGVRLPITTARRATIQVQALGTVPPPARGALCAGCDGLDGHEISLRRLD